MEFAYSSRILEGMEGLNDLAGKRVLFVTDPQWRKKGCLEQIEARLHPMETRIYDHARPAATAMGAAEVTQTVKSFAPDWVVALGSRGAVETARAAVYFSKTGVKLAVIPGLAGICSATGDQVVLTHGQGNHRLMGRHLLPERVVLLEWEEERPAEAGFAILACCLEGAMASGAGSITDALVKDAFAAVFGTLPAFCAGEGKPMRLLQAGAMAGMAASQAGLGMVEAMTATLSSLFQLNRDSVCAALLPAAVQCCIPLAGSKLALLARAAGFGGSTQDMVLQNLKNGLLRLRRELGLPQTLAQAGLPPEKLWQHCEAVVSGVLADPVCRSGPAAVEDFMIRRVLTEAAGNV